MPDVTSPPSSQPSEVIIGIDLGTTNSLVAVCDARGPRVIPDSHGRALLPSVVRIREKSPISSENSDGGPFRNSPLPAWVDAIGKDASDRAVEYPDRTVYSVKRLMGRGIADVLADFAHLTYAVVAGEHDTARVQVGGRVYSPQEISSAILAALRQQAEQSLGHAVHKAVITVPAYFDDAQRQATRDAGRLAGLDVVRIVNEPTAAALAYGIGTRATKPETIAVYDLGGGTFDISILQVTPANPLPLGEGGERSEPGEGRSFQHNADPSFFQVLSTAGDTHLGGDDVDRLISDLVLKEIRDQFGATLDFPPATRQALRLFSEATKIRLSADDSADLRVDLGDGRYYMRTLTRQELEAMIRPLVDQTLAACRRAVRDAKVAPSQIDRVVMVGGSTRIPLVRQAVGEFFGKTPYTALDPDQVVALGAAVQAGILAGSATGMLLLDVIPLSLGIETMGGAVAKLIVRNSTVPARATEMFSTSVDGQTSVKIHVLQGERELVRDCRSLATFDLRGIPPMPAGIPQIEVEFLVDANGILSVNARERRSGKRAGVQVMPRYGLTRAEVDAMEQAAFTHARQDMHAHRVIDLAVNAALDIKWIREAMTRVGDAIDADYRASLDARIATLESFVTDARRDAASVDADAFHRAKDELDRASMRLHEIAIVQSLRDEGAGAASQPMKKPTV